MSEPVVLIPGMMCDARLFQAQITALSRERAVMVAPVCIGERIEEIASALLTVTPAKFAVAGHGLGGIVAMELLRRAPDRVTRIALMDTSPLPETPAQAAAREPQIIAARAGRLDDIMQTEIAPKMLAAGPRRAEAQAVLLAMGRSLGRDVFIRQSRALQRLRDQQATLRRCRAPALVLCGAADALYPGPRHAFMADLIPHADLRVIAEAGHLPTLEAPDETTEALRGWLAQPYVLR